MNGSPETSGYVPPDRQQEQDGGSKDRLLYEYVKQRRHANSTDKSVKGAEKPGYATEVQAALGKMHTAVYTDIDRIGKQLDQMGVTPAEIDQYERDTFPEKAFKEGDIGLLTQAESEHLEE